MAAIQPSFFRTAALPDRLATPSTALNWRWRRADTLSSRLTCAAPPDTASTFSAPIIKTWAARLLHHLRGFLRRGFLGLAVTHQFNALHQAHAPHVTDHLMLARRFVLTSFLFSR